jgi:hypothetical protein
MMLAVMVALPTGLVLVDLLVDQHLHWQFAQQIFG